MPKEFFLFFGFEIILFDEESPFTVIATTSCIALQMSTSDF